MTGSGSARSRCGAPSKSPGSPRGSASSSRALRGRRSTDAADEEQRLFVGGAAGLLDELRSDEIGAYRSLLDALEKRAALLDVLAAALDPRRPFVRVGEELEHPALRELALVGATYGVAHRTLGAVSLLGPLRMDYDKAIRSVRSAARELSRFVEDVYADELMATDRP